MRNGREQSPWKRLRRLLALSLSLLSFSVLAAETPVYIDQVAPLYFQENGVGKGLLYELVGEMARRTGTQSDIIPVPLMRLRSQVSRNPHALGTMWRLPDLEADYRWWFKLFDTRFVLVATTASTHDISSIEAAKNLRVGVILGSPAELAARRLGFHNIQVSTDLEGLARKLSLGRVDVWIGSPRVIQAVYARLGIPIDNFRMGKEVASLDIYLVSSLAFASQEAERWRVAFEGMKKDGVYEALLKKYPDVLPNN